MLFSDNRDIVKCYDVLHFLSLRDVYGLVCFRIALAVLALRGVLAPERVKLVPTSQLR